jgi:ABC-2 type transport system ATP-binding protein
MSSPAIEVSGLTKRYGATLAVHDLSFTVQAGRVTGFLGPNGAGKSTTMRLMLGLDRPDAGRATVFGRRYAELSRPLSMVGAMLEAKATHKGRTAYNHLRFLAQTQGYPERRVGEVIDAVGLGAAARRRAGGFSLGMGQRLGIAAALLGDPKVLVLDEPVNGLDPEGIVWIRTLMKEQAARGRAVLVSSHLMNEMAVTADHLIVIGRGRLMADCTTRDFIDRNSRHSVLVKSPDISSLTQLVMAEGGQLTPTGSTPDEAVVTGVEAPRIAELAARGSVVIYELTPQRASLEEAFMELTRDAAEHTAQATTASADPNHTPATTPRSRTKR